MIKFEHTEVIGWEHAIRGMRNPMNSWERGDSGYSCPYKESSAPVCGNCTENICIGKNDYDLMMRLAKGGPLHAKYRRMITVYVDITAPLYWWKEFDTYKVGTVANSCSTMHKIHAKKFTLDDFSTEHLYSDELEFFKEIIERLNGCRTLYLQSKNDESARVRKNDWWQMIQLLPSSYNQKRTVMLNYEVLANIYKSRRNHKLDEWSEHKPKKIDITTSEDIMRGDYPKYIDGFELEYFGFCDWIKTLPYSELITDEKKNRYFEHDTESDKVGKQIATPDPSRKPEKVDGISNASLTLDDGVNPSIKFDGVIEASITLDDSINVVRNALKDPKFATRAALDANGNTCRGEDKSVADALFDAVYGLNLSWFKDDEDLPDHYKKAMSKLNEGFKDKNDGKK